MLPQELPKELSELLASIAADFPQLLEDNLVGIYLWGSLTYDAFDPNHSDVDCIVVTKRYVEDGQFSRLEEWFATALETNPWAAELEMRFVIDGEFLDKTSNCCVFQHGKLVRTGSDGNPIMWINIGNSGITLWGTDAKEIAPAIKDSVLNDSLLLEFQYLKEDLESNIGDRSQLAFKHNSYAVLTACRIFYTAVNRDFVSKEKAFEWTMILLPSEWKEVLEAANKNRLLVKGITTEKLETDAAAFVRFVVTLALPFLKVKETREPAKVVERDEPFPPVLIETKFPQEIGSEVIDIAPVNESVKSDWILLTADSRLFSFDADNRKATRLAQCLVAEHTEEGSPNPIKLKLHVSANGRFAGVVNDFGLTGEIIDLQIGTVTLRLFGGDYFSEHVPFSCAFAAMDGRTVLIHRTDWNRLDISDPRTGDLLTERITPKSSDAAHYLDYFHGNLNVSPDNRQVLDDGWIWHPVGCPTTWGLERWFKKNEWESEDGPSRKSLCWRTSFWNTPMTWIDSKQVAVFGIGEDDEEIVAGVRIFDVTKKEGKEPDGIGWGPMAKEIGSFEGPEGHLLSDGVWLYSSNKDGLSRWDIEDGSRTGQIRDFAPTYFHARARELVQLIDNKFVRLKLRN